ncbi:MAG: hypothetical protein E5X89_23030 [Mesorhizobium sp.]|nr:plasmid pRiA4b ORF-3 family protein [Mesorhizobium sp.]RWB28013.1 MAG: hypothetical protein EOQ43_24965 [Mesorhizobium sp.]RWE67278.1 MAG: hypothetical protein EOS62_15930 [Mesorhizobium sp.]RWI14471.1 MAG: hypothetical protein EOQ92_29015 [Mesorhizobium sp.]RWK32899.1 MAG: hypothetical protein EOR46_30080 [Mesorhizobium sp.]RWK90108.1 MAG: hypothetical protein EOR53_31205 [Mesorhizobium sp.]
MSGVANSQVYQLKVSLRRISPMISRRLLVPEEMTLYALHRTIQIAFGWEDCHLHAFKLHGRHYGRTWTGERHRDAAGREVTFVDLQLRVRQRILYEYDFGDLWEHRSGLRPSMSGRAARSIRSASPARVPARPKILVAHQAMRRSSIGSASATSSGYFVGKM